MEDARLPEQEAPEGTWHSMLPPPKRTRLIYGATEEFITESARLDALAETQSHLQRELSRVQREYFPALAELARQYPENFDEWEVKHLEVMPAIVAAANGRFPTPEAGSALADDRAAGAPFGVDIVSLADWRLRSATDLLRTVVALSLSAAAFGSNTILTLTRSALLAASELVWLLQPEDQSERLARACSLDLAEVSGEKHMLDELGSLVDGTHGDTHVVPEHVASRESGLKKAQSLWGRADRRGRSVVSAAANYLSDVHDDDDRELAAAVITQWFTGSGVAHSNAWQGKYRASTGSEPLRDLVSLSAIPLMLTEAGLALSRKRSLAPRAEPESDGGLHSAD